jgi:hypothetical protein
MWEYKRTDIKFKSYLELISALNTEGKEGWEVIYYQEDKIEKYGSDINVRILFKRLI